MTDLIHLIRMQLKEQLRAEAARLGFSLFGVTTPHQPIHFEKYEEWVDTGKHAEMEYLATPRAREARANPRVLLNECRSIVVIGTPYSNPEIAPPTQPFGGRVAAYAWGADYHDILIPRLKELTQFLEKATGKPVAAKPYTDTGPILERDMAQRAGLGWIGKNTCLIDPRSGSYYLLAELLLDLELEADDPFTVDRCGSCKRCIEACPTSCIQDDRTLDARRCISYLTIENKGAIDAQLRNKIGNWIFGCDICQQVCPWNRFAAPQGDPVFSPRSDLPPPNLLNEFTLSPEDFNRKFKGSPIRRARRRGYLRNVVVALGNQRDPKAVPSLIESLYYEKEPLIRGHAAWALGQIGGSDALDALHTAIKNETDASVQVEIHAALFTQSNL